MIKSRLRKERVGQDDDQGSNARNGKKGRAGREGKEKGLDDPAKSSVNGQSALGENQSSQVKSESESAVALGGQSAARLSHNVCYKTALKTLGEKGRVVLNDLQKLTVSYLDLCSYIREQQIAPDDVTKVLLDCGFRKERVSEIKRVSYSSDEIFNAFRSRLIGWKTTLERVRRNRNSQELVVYQWNNIFRSFERQLRKSSPPKPYYKGSGNCVLMWNESDYQADPVKLVSFDGWKVRIERTENGSTNCNQ